MCVLDLISSTQSFNLTIVHRTRIVHLQCIDWNRFYFVRVGRCTIANYIGTVRYVFCLLQIRLDSLQKKGAGAVK